MKNGNNNLPYIQFTFFETNIFTPSQPEEGRLFIICKGTQVVFKS